MNGIMGLTMLYSKPHMNFASMPDKSIFDYSSLNYSGVALLSEISTCLGQVLSQSLSIHGIKPEIHSDHIIDELMGANSGIPVIAILDPLNDPHATFARAKRLQECKIPMVFLTQKIKPAWLGWALQLGASGWITMDSPVEEIVSIISQIATGRMKQFWSSKARQMLDLSEGKPQLAGDCVASKLTTRQLEVFVQLAKGKTVKEVATDMNLSEKSIDSHKYRIMQRLMLHDRVYLSRLAIREGYIDA